MLTTTERYWDGDKFDADIPAPVCIVAVYEIGRSYGGPEEGGWWYDTGRLVRVVRVFKPHQTDAA